ncbi:ATP-binding protein [Allostreptomyces psammosilenae]|uniref:Anti-sigma regulatory factor (Ser/Thr protein kinase) n=1 Tax=Allostreptomyces psammosilenae TaxID=1892865 RepID=A0A853A030_9ACTN|nr:ATP-binding protein [Allostreptomyces psammosilenae]NYI07936.1 anti-sigma regulatory factor (Ser/Thr protein kinase) [Allostreptomyces psammosilenae]
MPVTTSHPSLFDQAQPRRGRLGSALLTVAGDDRAPSSLRRFTRQALTRWRLHHPDTLDTAELTVSELATNSVRHATSPYLTCCLWPTSSHLFIEIHESTPTPDLLRPLPHPAPELRNPTPTCESGRGLLLVEHLAAGWGVTTPPAGSRTVWAALTRRPAIPTPLPPHTPPIPSPPPPIPAPPPRGGDILTRARAADQTYRASRHRPADALTPEELRALVVLLQASLGDMLDLLFGPRPT